MFDEFKVVLSVKDELLLAGALHGSKLLYNCRIYSSDLTFGLQTMLVGLILGSRSTSSDNLPLVEVNEVSQVVFTKRKDPHSNRPSNTPMTTCEAAACDRNSHEAEHHRLYYLI